LLAFLGLALVGWSDDVIGDRSISATDHEVLRPETRGPTRPPLHGWDFPEGVLALTWDDGPDVRTLELARYLHDEKIAASFFVVGEWTDGVSEEPGVGSAIHATGYRHLPVLADLVALGHRIGSHTENHVLLGGAAAVTVAEQVGQSQDEIDPFLANELRMFRAPGGSWSRGAASAIADGFLADVVGPFHWDIDGKDWEGSLYCRASAAECEPGPIPGRTRVRPDVIARRYAARATSVGRGIVLLHDRVGDVGSHYALDVARRLIPDLKARGFVFAAPVLAFGPLTRRFAGATTDDDSARFADIDGDGKGDLCRWEAGTVACAYGSASYEGAHTIAHSVLGPTSPMFRLPNGTRAMDLADVDGDGRADVCIATDAAIGCALAADGRSFGPLREWSTELMSLRSSAYAASFRLADVDGDGRADACVRSSEGLLCATSSSEKVFGHPHLWLGGHEHNAGLLSAHRLDLGDVDGDNKSDVCGLTRRGIACAISNGSAFGTATSWSLPGDFAESRSVRLADVNGDGRADLCASSDHGVACALSNGRGFKRSSLWAPASTSDARFADLNGDGRSDLCFVRKDRIDCGLAP
jgi:peptidoglycan/xylan/chitin deacetylase (PgdA/CDA1 family)